MFAITNNCAKKNDTGHTHKMCNLLIGTMRNKIAISQLNDICMAIILEKVALALTINQEPIDRYKATPIQRPQTIHSITDHMSLPSTTPKQNTTKTLQRLPLFTIPVNSKNITTNPAPEKEPGLFIACSYV